MDRAFVEYFKCPDEYADFRLTGELSGEAGYFRLGKDTICYGRTSSGRTVRSVGRGLYDASKDIVSKDSACVLPFEPTEVIDNLRFERYLTKPWSARDRATDSLARRVYDAFRPVMPVRIRKYLQRAYHHGWDKIAFPRWPVDCSVERIMEHLMTLAIGCRNTESIPFIWFWPEGYQSCAIMTHDVETEAGRDFCPHLMDINNSFAIKSSFQIIPEKRYEVTPEFIASIRRRGFEVNLHGLNHDGHLFRDPKDFVERAARINEYAHTYGAVGFRSPVMYRNLDWFGAFEFSYDMSVPNVAHLDPQRGGCCTVMPYFVGNILELPLTCAQDYALINILSSYSIDLWKTQIELILEKHGLVSFIVHPDYIMAHDARTVYESLLWHLTEIRRPRRVWVTLPREVDAWWRLRSRMRLVRANGGWQVEGEGSGRACVAYAGLANGDIHYEVHDPAG